MIALPSTVWVCIDSFLSTRVFNLPNFSWLWTDLDSLSLLSYFNFPHMLLTSCTSDSGLRWCWQLQGPMRGYMTSSVLLLDIRWRHWWFSSHLVGVISAFDSVSYQKTDPVYTSLQLLSLYLIQKTLNLKWLPESLLFVSDTFFAFLYSYWNICSRSSS